MLSVTRRTLLAMLFFAAFLVVLTTSFGGFYTAKEYIYTAYTYLEIVTLSFIFVTCVIYEPDPREIKMQEDPDPAGHRLALFLHSLKSYAKSIFVFIITPSFAVFIHFAGVEQYLSHRVTHDIDFYENSTFILEQFLKGAMWDFLEVIHFTITTKSITDSSWHTDLVVGLYRSIMGIYFLISIKHSFGLLFRSDYRTGG